jgi:hypothetical protein
MSPSFARSVRRSAVLAGILAGSAGVFAASALSLGGAARGQSTPPFSITALGGLRGDTYARHANGDTYEYSEFVTLDFTEKADARSVRSHLTIEPATPFRAVGLNYGKRIRINMRKVPGVSYRISLAPGTAARSGATLGSEASYTIATPAHPNVPAPLRATPNEPYRYGTLGHPFKVSLSGPNADRIIDLLADAGIRFVRIDYCGNQILGDKTKLAAPDFSIEDRIAEKLRARGITELPIIDQYCAPAWAAVGRPYPAIFADPQTFGEFAHTVAAHLAERFPAITRIEIFNEPNLLRWWTYPGRDANDGNRTGRGAALYMQAAYRGIKSGAPATKVVGPALSDGGADVDPRVFLRNMYAAGCGRGKCWDILSVHNYRWVNPTFELDPHAQDRFDIYKDLQAIAADNGDTGTHVMLTEWGFSAIDDLNGFDPEVQAEYIALGFNRMLADPTVDGIVYVNVYNGGAPKSFWTQTQVVDNDFTPRPGYDVIRRFAKN